MLMLAAGVTAKALINCNCPLTNKKNTAFEIQQQGEREVSSAVRMRCYEPAAGLSTSTMYNCLYKIKCAGSLESLANMQLALITHIGAHNA